MNFDPLFYTEHDLDQPVKETSSMHKYRTEVPNIVLDLGLDTYELSLYLHIKRIAGDHGTCFMRRKILYKKSGMGESKFKKVKQSLAKPRKELNGKSLISIEKRFRPDGGRTSDRILINDVWPENMREYSDPRYSERPPTQSEEFHTVGLPNDRQEEEPYIKKEQERRRGASAEAAAQLSLLFFDQIKTIDPKAPKPNFSHWARDMAALLQKDGREQEEVEAVIHWVFADFFWRQNILSPKKLREKFPQLVIGMKSEKRSPQDEEQESKQQMHAIKEENKSWVKKFVKKESPKNLRIYSNSIEIFFPASDGKPPRSAIIGYTESDFKKYVVYYCAKDKMKSRRIL